jgi:hypothetical protein
VESAAASAAPGRPAVPERSCGPGGFSARLQARRKMSYGPSVCGGGVNAPVAPASQQSPLVVAGLDKIEEISIEKQEIEEYNKYVKASKKFEKLEEISKMDDEEILFLSRKGFNDPEMLPKPRRCQDDHQLFVLSIIHT